MQQDFLKPRLIGGRFDEHSLPLDVLKDWSAFEELVIEVAKDIYMKENTDRKRTPRGFTDDFSLHLTAVEPGSAIPVLKRYFTGEKLPFSDHFDRALALVQAAIIAVNIGQAVPDEFPREYLGYFNRFGSSLREGERIEWTVGNADKPTVYDRATRKKLVLTGAKSYQASADMRGWITEVNAEKNSYTIKLIGGPKLLGSYPRELANSVLDALSEFQRDKFQSCKVLVRGLADYDLNDQPVRVAETQHIEMLDPNDVAARCEELAQLKDGWLDGEGKAPTRERLKAFKHAWDAASTESLPLPYIYPTPEGGIQMEWRQGDWELSAEVELEKLTAELLAVNVATRVSKDADADLSTPAGWELVTRLVTQPESLV
jgi:hypothetical protein